MHVYPPPYHCLFTTEYIIPRQHSCVSYIVSNKYDMPSLDLIASLAPIGGFHAVVSHCAPSSFSRLATGIKERGERQYQVQFSYRRSMQLFILCVFKLYSTFRAE